jgi:hypothetical protein
MPVAIIVMQRYNFSRTAPPRPPWIILAKGGIPPDSPASTNDGGKGTFPLRLTLSAVCSSSLIALPRSAPRSVSSSKSPTFVQEKQGVWGLHGVRGIRGSSLFPCSTGATPLRHNRIRSHVQASSLCCTSVVQVLRKRHHKHLTWAFALGILDGARRPCSAGSSAARPNGTCGRTLEHDDVPGRHSRRTAA